MTDKDLTLADFGWTSFFQSQFDPNEPLIPVRVMAVHRDRLEVAGPGIAADAPPFADRSSGEESNATIGDWLLLEPDTLRPKRLLDRRSLFKRRAAGTEWRLQLIAANVDTLFIVSSCNRDFNIARLERYLALAREADATPVVVLTKADLTGDPDEFATQARKLLPGLLVETLDARDPDSVALLAPWCGRGQTVALLGSSGVGKSTLVNTLTGEAIATQGIRAHDARGKHTTTGRALHRLPGGGWLVDTPGMRELQLTDAEAGIKEVFADLAMLARQCRFSDCQHETEPGCAVQAALVSGEGDARRLHRWRKLVAEEAHNNASLSERRARDRAFGKMTRRAMQEKKARRGE